MENSTVGKITFDSPAFYRIAVKGHIRGDWSSRLDGMAISYIESSKGLPVTILEGVLADQAALAGVLNTLYEWHLPMLSIECVRAADPENEEE